MKDDSQLFDDRRQAGRVLAGQLERYRGSPGLLVLGLARGGVAVGFEVARALQAALDVLVVRKLGFPGNEEYAIGAIASGGVRVMNPLPGSMLSADEIQAIVERELIELARREQFYRSQRPPMTITGRTVIVVDDGLATGSTMQAALLAVRQQHPLHLTAAVPVCAAESSEGLAGYADEVICAASPSPFGAVGRWYRHFPQATDDEVCSLLEDARREHVADLKSKKSMETGQ